MRLEFLGLRVSEKCGEELAAESLYQMWHVVWIMSSLEGSRCRADVIMHARGAWSIWSEPGKDGNGKHPIEYTHESEQFCIMTRHCFDIGEIGAKESNTLYKGDGAELQNQERSGFTNVQGGGTSTKSTFGTQSN